MNLSPPLPALLLGSMLLACAGPASRRPAASAAEPFGATAGEGGTPSGSAEAPPGADQPGAPPSAAGATPGTEARAASSAATVPERHGPPLPELTVKSFGLHIGGSGQDAAARDQFLRVLEGASARYMDCYRQIAEPGAVGTFGADLTVGGSGGKPRVGKPRTRLHGDEFAACMVRAFESVTFVAPPSGRAVVVSYSVKFGFKD